MTEEPHVNMEESEERALHAGHTPEHYVDGIGKVCSERKYMRLGTKRVDPNVDDSDVSTEYSFENDSEGVRLLAQPTLREDSPRGANHKSLSGQNENGAVSERGDEPKGSPSRINDADTLMFDSQATEVNSDLDEDVSLLSDHNVNKVVEFLNQSDDQEQSSRRDLRLSDRKVDKESKNGTHEGGKEETDDTDSETQKFEDEVDGSSKPVPIEKIISVQSDAEKIAELLGRADVVSLYERLKKRRSDPQRVERITNELLEEDTGTDPKPTNNCDISHKSTKDNPNSQEPSTSTDVKSVVADISAVSRELKKHHPELDVDPNEIYMRLESVINLPDRVERVVKTLLEEQRDLKQDESPSCAEDDIFEQVQKVLLKVPEADANRVFNLLEVFSDEANRIDKVIDHLNKNKNNTNCDTTIQDSSKSKSDADRPTQPGPSETGPKPTVRTADSFENDPLYKDMQQLAKIFPDRSKDEIYAHLEVYHNKPNRMELVMEEFLGTDHSRPDSIGQIKQTDPSIDSLENDVTDGLASGSGETDIVLIKFKSDLELLKAVFPDCDHEYLVEQMQEHFQHKGRVDMITAILINQPNYPRIKIKPQVQEQRRRLENLPLDIPEFLKMFPDPAQSFYDETKVTEKLYRAHAKVKLYREFAAWSTEYLDRRLKNHNYHYLPAYREIQNDMLLMDPNMQYNMADEEEERDTDWPAGVDEYFYRELLFAKHEGTIIEAIHKTKEARARRVELARQNNDLQECQCCFDDEILPEDMSPCDKGHLFCTECVCRSVEAALTEGKAAFPCLTGTCEATYPLSLLQEVLPAKSFSHVLRRAQQEELRQANIPDLVECPFCPYATVMPDENDKVLRCLNPDCLKESCRLCQEPSHIPLRCDEVEKQDEVKMRTFIENKMAEAMMRTCHDCGKRFYKIHGCNKMTCVCGASMCYVCREPITDYNHFNNNERCGVGHMDKLHAEEAEAAAVAAREEFLKDHPELRDMDLKNDPMKIIKDINPPVNLRFHYEHEDYDDDDDDEDDYDEGDSDDDND